MKKITILSLVLLFSAAVFAQNASISVGKNHQKVKPTAATAELNSTKAVIWSDDFSTPANWTIAAGVGTDNWVIGTTPPSGSFAIPVIASTTAANGFALFDSDLMCGGNQIGNLTTATSHSCVGHASVALVFQEMYRRWYDSSFVYVSNNGTTWTKFSVNKTFVNNDMTANPQMVSVNISSVAANQATVWIRFTFYSPSSLFSTNAGCGYSWMVDDVQLIDLVPNDITATKSFFDLDGSGYYELIPFSQMGIMKYGEDVMNNGSATQTNVTMNVNINAGTITAAGTPLASLVASAHDTVWVQPAITTPGVFTAYAAHLNVSQTQTDANLTDNVGDSITWYADPTYFARTDNPTVFLTPYSFGTGAPAITGMEYGANYQFKNAAQIDSIGVAVYLATPGTTLTGKLYTVVGTTHTLVAQTAPFTLVPANLPLFIRLPLITPYSVAAGTTQLCATVAMNIPTLVTDTIGVLCDDAFPGDAAVAGAAYLQVSGTWGWYSIVGTVPMVDLILHDLTIGIDESENTGNFSIYPNPAIEALNIVSDNNILSVRVTNTLGQLVASEVCDSKNLTINTSELLSGVYFVQVETTVGTFTRKFNIR